MLRSRLPAVVVAVLAIGCGQTEELVRPDFAKALSGPTVTATDPPFGRRGDIGVQVTISGSGFDNGSRASWERNGSPDPNISVRSTTFVSSTQLVATIDIATVASLSLYDVAVTTFIGGRKGIGTAKFEVTQAQPISGTESGFGVNENAEVAGRIGPQGAFYWNPVSGLLAFNTPGRAYDISEDGLTVAGFTGVCCDGAFVQVNTAGTWQYTRLPKDPAASYHVARSVGSDPSGTAVYVGGMEAYPAKGNNTIRRPRLWSPMAGGWNRVVLPAPASSDSPLFDVNAAGAAAGAVGGRASAWLPNGAGGWDLATFGAAGSQAWAINATGTLAVGYAASGGSTVAQYWTLSANTWTPHSLPGGCSEAVDIDTSGRILANGCANGNRRTPAVMSPPYSAGEVHLLGALGYATGTTTASRMSAGGTWIVGQAPYKSGAVGVRWTLGVP